MEFFRLWYYHKNESFGEMHFSSQVATACNKKMEFLKEKIQFLKLWSVIITELVHTEKSRFLSLAS